MTYPTYRKFVLNFKTRLFLGLYKIFDGLGQWFIKHCDTEEMTREEIMQKYGVTEND
jgi:hypothetical protein